MADINSVVRQLRQERDRIDAAINVLTSLTGEAAPIRSNESTRHISAAGRARIAAAARARWAKARRQQKVVSIAPAGKRRTLSPAARRRIAAAQRARWAKIRAGKK